MQKSNIQLLRNKKEWTLFLLLLSFILAINLKSHYDNFAFLKQEELFQTQALIANIYPKDDYLVVKLQTDNFDFYSTIPFNETFQQFDRVSITVVTSKVTFFEYLKSFFAPSLNVYKLNSLNNTKTRLAHYISSQHDNRIFQELYNALFFAIPISKELRDICAYFGISHLIAISGFHLSVIAFVMYWIAYFPYSYLHTRYFVYRNKKYDILCLTASVLLVYLIFTSVVPSFLRAFVMFILGVILLRNNIKLFSFETLLITVLLILSFFPKYIFSISLWFSLAGVFYIFLFFVYFKNLPKIGQILLFNAWIYLAMNPITNYFFGTTSYLQILSSALTIVFTFFYPLVALLHLFGVGNIFDEYLLKMFKINPYSSEILTPFWFFIIYVLLSLLAIKKKAIFILLNIMLVGFTCYIFYINASHYL